MRHRSLSLVVVLFTTIVISLLFACTPQKKISSGKTELEKVNAELQQHSSNLKELDAKRKTKELQNEIDDSTNARIKKYIDNTEKEIDTLIDQNNVLIAGALVNKSDWERLSNSLVFSKKSSKTISEKVAFLNDLINRNMVVKLDQDVLFEPGKYTVSPSVVTSIGKLFEPAAQEIDLFTKKYPDFPLSLVITAKGYADGTGIAEGSGLYRDLKARLSLSGREPDAKELNKELSRARAEAVKDLFKKFAAERSDNGIYIRNVLYLHEGKGDAFPDPKVKDYKTDDARRRVVLLFWSIFPD